MESTDHLEVVARREKAVDGCLLGRDSDVRPDASGLSDDIEARDPGRALAGGCQRGQQPNGRGLAGAVMAEQSEYRSGRNGEVEIAERPKIAVALAEPERLDPGPGDGSQVASCSHRRGPLVFMEWHYTTN
jgi:hypothetical protein